MMKTCMTPIEGITTHGVMKAAMKLMGNNMSLFSKQVANRALELVTLNLKLSIHENMDVREGASDMLGSLMKEISSTLNT